MSYATLDDLKGTYLGETLTLGKRVELQLVTEPDPSINPDWVGSYCYRQGRSTKSKEQSFVLLVDGQPQHPRVFVEIDAAVRVAQRVEIRYKDDNVQVLYIQLPKSHGFNGLRLGHQRTKDSFPWAGSKPLNLVDDGH